MVPWSGVKTPSDQRSERVGEWERNFALPPPLTQILSPNGLTCMEGRSIMSICSQTNTSQHRWCTEQWHNSLRHPVRSVQASARFSLPWQKVQVRLSMCQKREHQIRKGKRDGSKKGEARIKYDTCMTLAKILILVWNTGKNNSRNLHTYIFICSFKAG